MYRFWLTLFSIFITFSSGAASKYSLQEQYTGLNTPWALEHLRDNTWLVTEKSGRLWLLSEQSRTDIAGLPGDIYSVGQGGLLDVLVDSEFAQTQRLIISYVSGDSSASRLNVISTVLNNDSLTDSKILLSVSPDKDTPVHYGGRLAQLPDGSLLVTSGDGWDYREDAQKLTSQLGKILRVNKDGSIPQDNPFVRHSSPQAAAMFSIGHRNHQGLIFDTQTNRIWSHEHGPDGGDEINIIRAGENYGWPVITEGKDYIGANISPFTAYPGMRQPLFGWSPSVAPSGMILYRGEAHPEFDGNLLITTLKDQSVLHVTLDGDKVIDSMALDLGVRRRWRDIDVGPDGGIYLLSDGANAALYRLIVAK
ncbi:PQQ-dependent sugar dehydrogenase [Aestuariibacter salexigens]|uniref:PQQ-dependent sugar dehydrogenase n=1 Tax=Aestuariibacter salexigens TaxID=226010 RepID=UPI00041BCD72|nr:PQQ-dependent sugar dehydrogenase [Aestuariibacter salexigens]